jgi:hypothetical protein
MGLGSFGMARFRKVGGLEAVQALRQKGLEGFARFVLHD